MFEGTFILGDYPMQGIEWLVGVLGDWVRNNMSEGPLKDLLVDGIIGGVGGVIVFLPNILICIFHFFNGRFRIYGACSFYYG